MYLGWLGPVLIPIRPGDERDLRLIKPPVAQRLVQETTTTTAENECLCNRRMVRIRVSEKAPCFGKHPEPQQRWVMLPLSVQNHVCRGQSFKQSCQTRKCSFLWCIAKRIGLMSSTELKSSLIGARYTHCSCCSRINSHEARRWMHSLPLHVA